LNTLKQVDGEAQDMVANEQPEDGHMTLKALVPTNKWTVATIGTLATIAGMIWVGDGINTDEEKLVVISLVAQRLAAYWARNDPDPVVVQNQVDEGSRDPKTGRWRRKAIIAGEPGVGPS
jgi:hypothetical protein